MLAGITPTNADQWLSLLSGVDAQRRPEQLDNLIAVVRAWNSSGGDDFARIERLVRGAAGVLAAINFQDISREGTGAIAERARALRLKTLQTWLEGQRSKR